MKSLCWIAGFAVLLAELMWSGRVATAQDAGDAATENVSIADLDLARLSFEINDILPAKDNGIIAMGTSNGVNWTLVADSHYAPNSNRESRQRYNDLPGSYDDLHLGSNFTLVFDRPVKRLLVAIANDNDTGDGPRFLNNMPSQMIDARTGENADQIIVDDRGGALILYNDPPSQVFQHFNDNGINDGFDVSFFAFAK